MAACDPPKSSRGANRIKSFYAILENWRESTRGFAFVDPVFDGLKYDSHTWKIGPQLDFGKFFTQICQCLETNKSQAGDGMERVRVSHCTCEVKHQQQLQDRVIFWSWSNFIFFRTSPRFHRPFTTQPRGPWGCQSPLRLSWLGAHPAKVILASLARIDWKSENGGKKRGRSRPGLIEIHFCRFLQSFCLSDEDWKTKKREREAERDEKEKRKRNSNS